MVIIQYNMYFDSYHLKIPKTPDKPRFKSEMRTQRVKESLFRIKFKLKCVKPFTSLDLS